MSEAASTAAMPERIAAPAAAASLRPKIAESSLSVLSLRPPFATGNAMRPSENAEALSPKRRTNSASAPFLWPSKASRVPPTRFNAISLMRSTGMYSTHGTGTA